MNEKIFLVRTNLSVDTTLIDEFFNKGQIAVNMDLPVEKEIYHDLTTKGASAKRKQFVNRWYNLEKLIEIEDIIVIALYKHKHEARIGKIRRGTKSFDYLKNADIKMLQMHDFVTMNLKKYPIFRSVLPMGNTVSPVKQREDFIRDYYYKKGKITIPVRLENVSPKLLELICTEWLRSVSEIYKIKYQLLLTGGNYPDIDIYGVTANDKILAAQVSYTSDNKILKSKINKLKVYSDELDIILLFCNSDMLNDKDVKTINLKTVWQDLIKHGYFKMLKSMVRK